MGELFWSNVELLLAEKEMTLADLVKQMFVGQYHYPSEFQRFYRRVYRYKRESFLLQERWVDRIVAVLEIDYEDLFKRY